MRRRCVLVAGAVLAALTTTSAASTHDDGPDRSSVHQRGTITNGGEPLGGAEVKLYQAGDGWEAGATVLGSARSDSDGRFRISYHRPGDPDAVLYLVAEGAARGDGYGYRTDGHEPVRMSAVMPSSGRSRVVVNERTTVATAFAMAQFMEGPHIAGPYPGPQNAALTSHNLADVRTGGIARVLAAPPNGDRTSTLRSFNSLANLLAVCADQPSCRQLFRLSSPDGRPQARDTLQAALNIARAPGHRVDALFEASRTQDVFAPDLGSAPDAWTLALSYVGNGRELDGPGNVAFDADGNAWIINNYEFGADPTETVCGGEQVSKLTPDGRDAPGAPFSGGGVYGAGYGVTLDPEGDVWVGNFGFQGRGCDKDQERLSRSVSQFGPAGRPLSPPNGWRFGDIDRPQGTVSDEDGGIWVANCGNDTVTRIPGGEPRAAENIDPGSDLLAEPFDIAVDTRGRAWVTSNRTSSVLVLAPDGTPVGSVDGGGIDAPMGIASDSLGNVWVANSDIIQPPCGDVSVEDFLESILDPGEHPSVTMVDANGRTPNSPFENGGLHIPWGVAVDGDDNVWVANFGGQRVAHLCGADTSACPPGHRTGQPISPAETGYTSDALLRNTGIQIDPSGNVWLANNWQMRPRLTNPGGHEMVVFVGLAAPVKAPLTGPPQRP
ncbi:hypothetical protein KIK06_11680 [Nocardiopsis sp. EMB25]|uniref:hypothetical protein n=1 Tax=Nocardiopsis sp. EMB25 TaxID=2835867 RepID=UPI0022840484|nr:hypothetical protein [Nocardiopsis sp. EMB25]MCY9784552.1 hypothetical protein [Nocardiopsis sp. EMB25]